MEHVIEGIIYCVASLIRVVKQVINQRPERATLSDRIRTGLIIMPATRPRHSSVRMSLINNSRNNNTRVSGARTEQKRLFPDRPFKLWAKLGREYRDLIRQSDGLN